MSKPAFDGTSRDIITGIAVLSLCGLVSVFFPVIGFFSFVMLPLPVIFYRIKLGRQPAAIVALLAWGFITVMTGGGLPDTWLAMGMMGLGFFLGECMEKDLPIEKIIVYSCGIVMIAGTACLMIYADMSGTGLVNTFSVYLKKNLQYTVSTYKELGVPKEQIQALTQSLDQIHYVLMRIMPSLIAAGLIFAAWLNLLGARVVLGARNLPVPFFGELKTWKAPENMVWGVIGCFLMIFMPVMGIKFIGINGLILLMVVYLFQGLAIVSFYFDKKDIPKIFRVLIYGIIAIQQILLLLVIGVGFFDMWINFRRLGTQQDDQSPL